MVRLFEGLNQRSAIPLCVLALLLLSITALHWGTVSSLVRLWLLVDQSYSHGFLVVAIVIYWVFMLLWKRKATLSPNPKAIVPILLISVVWLVGESTLTLIVAQAALPLLFWCALYALFGWRFAKKVVIPSILLFLALPAWDVFTPVFRGVTTIVVQSIVSILSIPAYFDGFRIEFPSGVIEIADSCAGLNYFLMGQAFALIYVFQNRLGWKSLVKCAAVALALSLLGNWIRVFILVLVGYYTDMTHSLMEDHGTFGWVLFGVVLVPMMILFHRITASDSSVTRQEEAEQHVSGSQRNCILFTLFIFVSIAILPLWFGVVRDETISDSYNVEIEGLGQLSQFGYTAWRPEYIGVDHHYSWQGEIASTSVLAQVALYTTQQQGKELIFYRNKLAPAHKIKKLAANRLFEYMPVEIVAIESAGVNHLVLWQYNIGGKRTTSTLKAKLYQFYSLFSKHRFAALITLSTPCRTNCEAELLDVSENVSVYENILNNLKFNAQDSG